METHKIVIRKPGGYQQLKVESFAVPKPGDGEVRVRIRAAGVNYADCAVRWGLYKSAKEFVGWPITPGFEFSGIVEAVGKNANQFKVGDSIFGVTRFGAYTTHLIVKQDQLRALPKKLAFDEAAGFPGVFLTAYHALFQQFQLRPNMKILVHSAAGGVGGALLQLAKRANCQTVGVVGASHKVDLAKKFGATWVIDKSKEDLWNRAKELVPKGYDVVLDANGVQTLRQSYKILKATGKLVSYGFHSMLPKKGGRVHWLTLGWNYLRSPRFNPIHMTNENKSIITFNLSFLFDRTDIFNEAFDQLIQWIEDGSIIPLPVTTFPLKDVARAHAAIESGQTTGKLVLTT